jgi:hypothetical protein
MSKKKRALKPPPKAVLRELADLLEVPEVKRNFHYNEILGNVRDTCELKELSDGLTKEKSAKMLRSALALQETLWDLNRREAEFIDKMLYSKSAFLLNRISADGTAGLREIAHQLALLFSLLSGKAAPRWPSEGPVRRRRGKSPGGRRPGSITNSIFQDFVTQLWISTRVAGGKLSLAKSPVSGKPQGSLLKAIEMLKPYLPDGLVPNVLPARTLEKIRADCIKLEAQYEELEAETSGVAEANTAAHSKRNTKSRRPNN